MKWSRSACASAEPSVGSVPAPSSSSSTRLPSPATSTMRVIVRRCPLKVDSDWATDCSSPMSARTSRKTGRALPVRHGHVQPRLVHEHEQADRAQGHRLAARVRPGDDERAVVVAEVHVDGHDAAARPGWRADRSVMTVTLRRAPDARRPVSSARRARHIQRSKRASASRSPASGSALAATCAESSSRTRSSSACAASCASRQALASSTATSGSTKSVWPLPDWSWTMPFTRLRASARTGTT